MKIDIEKIKSKKTIKELLEFCIINIDKPSGPTSFIVSDFIRKSFNDNEIKVSKTSHFGTLDPKVTGVLPIAVNRACKLTGFFLGEEKEYVGIMRLHEKVSIEKIKRTIKEKFTGIILQTPPVRSRVKRVEREREIISFEILESDESGKDFLFRTVCQGGTYIRKLIDDLGKELGIGAHMLELRRTRAGIFLEDAENNYLSVSLYDFEKALKEYKEGKESRLREILIPGEIVSELFPVLEVNNDAIKHLFTGKNLHKESIIKSINIEFGKKFVVFCESKFIGIYQKIDDPKIFGKPEFVLQPVK